MNLAFMNHDVSLGNVLILKKKPIELKSAENKYLSKIWGKIDLTFRRGGRRLNSKRQIDVWCIKIDL